MYRFQFANLLKVNTVTLTLRKKCPYSKFFWPALSAFGLNMSICSVNLCIHSKCGKMQTRKTLNTDTFYAVLFC